MDYLIFVRNLDELPEVREVGLVVKDLTPGRHKYEARYVKATLSSSPQSMPGADKLWIGFDTGLRHSKPWAIKIIAEIGQYPPSEVRQVTLQEIN